MPLTLAGFQLPSAGPSSPPKPRQNCPNSSISLMSWPNWSAASNSLRAGNLAGKMDNFRPNPGVQVLGRSRISGVWRQNPCRGAQGIFFGRAGNPIARRARRFAFLAADQAPWNRPAGSGRGASDSRAARRSANVVTVYRTIEWDYLPSTAMSTLPGARPATPLIRAAAVGQSRRSARPRRARMVLAVGSRRAAGQNVARGRPRGPQGHARD
jgi:hypothetical protein